MLQSKSACFFTLESAILLRMSVYPLSIFYIQLHVSYPMKRRMLIVLTALKFMAASNVGSEEEQNSDATPYFGLLICNT